MNQDAAVQVSVVIPVYNSARSLPELHERLVCVFENNLERSFEIIFVDDASPNDETWPAIEALQEQDPRVRAFQLMRNAGQHNATMCGLRQARGRHIVMMDDDLQHPPEEIPKLFDCLAAHPRWDAVLAIPAHREHTGARNLGSLFFNALVGMAIPRPPGVILASFRLITRELCDALVSYRGRIITIGSLICLNTRGVGNVEVAHARREHGKSGYSARKLLGLAVSNVFNFSALPLQLISVFGFLFAGISAVFAFY
ncbi:MAG TPA: glycosyltransferase, partial [Candidatus Hydrogenedentes bacterium]|nr:glycosyltransferase [Candidatus Hydrogenedentota bacterium]